MHQGCTKQNRKKQKYVKLKQLQMNDYINLHTTFFTSYGKSKSVCVTERERERERENVCVDRLKVKKVCPFSKLIFSNNISIVNSELTDKLFLLFANSAK